MLRKQGIIVRGGVIFASEENIRAAEPDIIELYKELLKLEEELNAGHIDVQKPNV